MDKSTHLKLSEVFQSQEEKKSQQGAYFQRLSDNIHDNQEAHSWSKSITQRAGFIKRKVLENLEKHLIEWETSLKRTQIKVFWSETAEDCLKKINTLLAQPSEDGSKNYVGVGKSFIYHEIQCGEFLQKQEVKHLFLDFKQYYAAENKLFYSPYIQQYFIKDYENQYSNYYNKVVSQTLDINILIIEAEYLISSSGSIVVRDGEGIIQNQFQHADKIIILVGIEQVLPNFDTLELFTSLYDIYSGNKDFTDLSPYLIIHGNEFNTDSKYHHKEISVMLVDNGRSDILASPLKRSALACIKCGACLLNDEGVANHGLEAYHSKIPGKIGALLNPYIFGWNSYIHQSYTHTLCGNVSNICPVEIDFEAGILKNRQEEVEVGNTSKMEDTFWYFWKNAMSKRSTLNGRATLLKNLFISVLMSKSKDKNYPKIPKKSFNEEWIEQLKN